MSLDLQKKINFIFDKRFCEFALHSLGKQMNIKLVDGKKAAGLFYTAHPLAGSVIAKNYTQMGEEENEDTHEEEAHLLENDEFVYFSVENLERAPVLEDINAFLKPKLKEQSKKEMKIDAEISTKKGTNTKKDLVKWDIGADLGGKTMTLGLGEEGHKIDSWNQFEVNKEQFGIDFHYKEEEYTTKLDISKIDDSLKKKAERIEREILNDEYENKHILEERGKVELSEDYDEEKKFSAVLGSGRYVDSSQKQLAASKEPAKEADVKFNKSGPLKFINKNKIGSDNNSSGASATEIPFQNQDFVPEEKKLSNSEKQNKTEKERNEKGSGKMSEKSNEKTEKDKTLEKSPKLQKPENKRLPAAQEKNTEKEKPPKHEKNEKPLSPKVSNPNEKSHNTQKNSEKAAEKIDESQKNKTVSENDKTTSSISLKTASKKFSEKSMKLSASLFIAGGKPDSSNSIPEFKPQLNPSINEFKPQFSTNTNEFKPQLNANITEFKPQLNTTNAESAIVENQTTQNKEIKLENFKKSSFESFKLADGDAHLSIKFKCRNISQDVNHNSKKTFKGACLENWEKLKDSYNHLTNDMIWKKLKLEYKDPNAKSVVSEPPKSMSNPAPFQPSTQQSFFPTGNMMYPPVGMNLNPGGYPYVGNMYMPNQGYGGYGMGYDYGYQGGYMNPMMAQPQMGNMKYYGGDTRGNTNFQGKK